MTSPSRPPATPKLNSELQACTEWYCCREPLFLSAACLPVPTLHALPEHSWLMYSHDASAALASPPTHLAGGHMVGCWCAMSPLVSPQRHLFVWCVVPAGVCWWCTLKTSPPEPSWRLCWGDWPRGS